MVKKKKKFILKRLYKNLFLESTISIELAEPSSIKNEPIESEQVYSILFNIQIYFSLF
jgi:hypothetical protein